MKPIFQFIINFIFLVQCTIVQIVGLLWYGKLLKVSPFYWSKYSFFTVYQSFNDTTLQSTNLDDVSAHTKKRIIEAYIQDLYKNDVFMNNVAGVSIPLFNGKEVYGTQSIGHILHEQANITSKTIIN